MKSWKKALALVLAVSMLLSVMSLGIMAADEVNARTVVPENVVSEPVESEPTEQQSVTTEESEPSAQNDSYPVLELNQKKEVTLGEGEYAYFSFTPQESKMYSFYSYSGGSYLDTYGTLYKVNEYGDRIRITSNDDGGNEGNFRFIWNLTAGSEYLLEVRLYDSNQTGTFEVCVEEVPEYEYYVSDGGAVITGYNGEGGDVVIPSTIDGYPVTCIDGYAFSDCDSLTSVVIPNGVTMIGGYAFEYCTSLTSVTIPSGVTSIGNYAFYKCTSLTNITIVEDNTVYCSVDGVLFSKDMKTLIVYPAGKTDKEYVIPSGVTEIGSSAFAYCTSLTSVTIPNSVTSIGNYAFYNCTSLTNITIVEDNTVYCSVDGVLFSKDMKTLIVYPAGKTDKEYVIPSGVTEIGSSAFAYCTSLTSVTIPNSVTSIGNYAFYNCTSLTNITVVEDNTEYCSVDGVLFSKDMKTLIKYLAGKTDKEYVIPSGVTEIGSGAFEGCGSLTSVTIPNGVTMIGDYAFEGCGSLTSVTIPNSVTSIGSSAFANCTSLTSVTILNGVTSIGSSAFANCTSLASVTIPNSVTEIWSYAFEGCTGLKIVTIPDSVTYIDDYAFMHCGSATGVANVIVNFIGTRAQWNEIGCHITATVICTCPGEHIFTDENDKSCDVCDYGVEYDYPSLVLNEKANVTVENGEKAYFTFVPEKSGGYMFYSSKDGEYCDTYGALYSIVDGVPQRIAQSFGGTNGHFMISANLVAGTMYLLEMYGFGDFDVVVEETPIESIEIKPKTIIEKTNGYEGHDEHAGKYFYSWHNWFEYTIKFKDGTIITDSNNGFYYNNNWYSFDTTDTQSENEWIAGNTYTGTVSVLGYSTNVSITIEKSPVKNIEFEPIMVIENTGGYITTGFDGREFFCYEWYQGIKYKVTYNDGRVETGTGGGFYIGDNYCSLNIYDSQHENHWTVGNTYTGTVKCMGFSATVDISVVDTAIESIEFSPKTIRKNTNGYMSMGPNGEYFHYNLYSSSLEFKVKFKDGTETTMGGNGINYNDRWYEFDITDNQHEEHWVAGNTYKATVTVMNYSTEISVTIEDSPIDSVEIEPISIIENTNREFNGMFYEYNWYRFINYKITYKNGKVITGSGTGYYDDGEWVGFSTNDNQYEENWTVGNTYTVNVNVLDYSVDVSVTIEESPVESIEVEPIVILENTHGYFEGDTFYYQWETNAQYTVKFKDGTKITGTNLWDGVYYKGDWYSFNCGSEGQPWSVNNTYNVTVSWLGATANTTVTICAHNENDIFSYMLYEGNAIITGCSKAQKVLTIPSEINGYTVVGITDLSGAISQAEEVIIPDSVTMLSGDIFGGCSNLKKITIGKGITKLSNDQFLYVYNLEEIIVSPDNPNYTSVDGVVYNKDMTAIVAFPVGKTGTYVVPSTVVDVDVLINNLGRYDVEIDFGNSNTDYKFENGVLYDSEMTTIYWVDKSQTGKYDMPDSVTSVGPKAFQNASFSEIIVSENVSEIVYYSFAFNTNLEKVVLPEKLKTIGEGVFENCYNLKEVNLPSELEGIGSKAFRHTRVLEANIPGSVTEIGYEAYYSSGLQSLTLNEGTEIIESNAFASSQVQSVDLPDSLVELGWGAFRNTPLSSVTFGTGLQYIPERAFEDTELTKVYLPENIRQIGDYAFQYCPIETLSLEEGNAYIGEYAFYESSLKELVLPQSVTDITYNSFSYSKDLLMIDVPDTLETLDGTAFSGTAWWNAQPDGVVYLENYLYGYKGNMPENTEIVVEDGTTIIASYAFDTEVNLKQLTIPAQVKEIGVSAFNSCVGLEKIIVDENNEHFSTNEAGTVLYDEYQNVVWSKAIRIISVDDLIGYFNFGEEYNFGYNNYVWIKVECESDIYDWGVVPISMIEVTGYDPLKSGDQEVTLKIGEYTYTYTVTVGEFVAETIWIEQLPSKTEYDLNQSFRPAGMVVMCETTDGRQITLEDYTITGFDSTTAGTKTVTVTYGDLHATFEVVVNGEKVTFVDTNNTTITPEKPAVEVSAPIDAIENGASLVVEEVPLVDAGQNVELPEEFEEDNSIIFEIRFEKEEQTVQPTKEVTVSIPVPAGMNGNNCKIYHITATEKTDMNAVFVDGYLVFTTTHFSYYGLVEVEPEVEVEGFEVSGNVTSFGDESGEVVITLLKNGTVYKTVKTTNGVFTFDGVVDGEYTMTVSKENHATRTYNVTVAGGNVVQDVVIHLLGDINGDGIVNVTDVGKANAHVKCKIVLEGYELVCADVSGDERVNVTDVGKMSNHVKNLMPLW